MHRLRIIRPVYIYKQVYYNNCIARFTLSMHTARGKVPEKTKSLVLAELGQTLHWQTRRSTSESNLCEALSSLEAPSMSKYSINRSTSDIHSSPQLKTPFESAKPSQTGKKPVRPKLSLPGRECSYSTGSSDVHSLVPSSQLYVSSTQKQPPTSKKPARPKLSLPDRANTSNVRLSSPNLDVSASSHKQPLVGKKPARPKLSLDSSQIGYRSSNGTTHTNENSTCCVISWKPDESTTIDMLKIMWFHPDLTRHQAEAELRNAEEGVYLLRPRTEGGKVVEGYSLGVRSSHSVKHFKVSVEDGDLVLGEERFRNLPSFLEHFDNYPIIGDETGHTVVCRHPYPRDVDSIHDYTIMTDHFIPGKTRRKRIDESLESNSKTYSLVSKEGYLVKLGQRVKSWKRRWFVLKDNEMHYYANEKDTQPIKTISVNDITEVSQCDINDKQNTFQIVLPSRTFYIQAPSQSIMDEWMHVLEFKLKERS